MSLKTYFESIRFQIWSFQQLIKGKKKAKEKGKRMSYVVTESGIVQVSVRPACQKPAPIMFQTQVIIFSCRMKKTKKTKRRERQELVLFGRRASSSPVNKLQQTMERCQKRFQQKIIWRSFQSDGTGGDKKGEKGKDGNGPRRKSVGLVVRIFLYHLNNVLWSVFSSSITSQCNVSSETVGCWSNSGGKSFNIGKCELTGSCCRKKKSEHLRQASEKQQRGENPKKGNF